MKNMPGLLVVGNILEPVYADVAKGYRGVQRCAIDFPVEYYEAKNGIMEMHNQYIALTENDIYLHDLDFTKKLKEIYDTYYPNVKREIIEIVRHGDYPLYGSDFLGYDICDGDNSNIVTLILNVGNMKDEELVQESEFLRLLNKESLRFIKLLNENKLFKTYDDASNALNIIDKLFATFKRSSPYYHNEVVKIYLVG